MKLGEMGESRIRGYLFILGRSLRTFLRGDVVSDALREVESHIRERVDQVQPLPDERTALERVLDELGPPLRVAQAYATEMAVDEAISTGRVLPMARAVWQLACSTLTGFVAALGLFIGYATGSALLVVAALKPAFPDNVGLWVVDGMPRAIGALFPPPPGAELYGGYGIIPVFAAIGLGLLVATHRCSRRFLAWWRSQRSTWRDDPALGAAR